MRKTAIVGCRPKWMADPAWVKDRVVALVESLPHNTIVISGGAPGVDRWAAEAAHRLGLVVVTYEADWDAHGKGAGFIRNQLIVDQADEVLAFWDGKSPGTADTIAKARKALKDFTVFPIEGK